MPRLRLSRPMLTARDSHRSLSHVAETDTMLCRPRQLITSYCFLSPEWCFFLFNLGGTKLGFLHLASKRMRTQAESKKIKKVISKMKNFQPEHSVSACHPIGLQGSSGNKLDQAAIYQPAGGDHESG